MTKHFNENDWQAVYCEISVFLMFRNVLTVHNWCSLSASCRTTNLAKAFWQIAVVDRPVEVKVHSLAYTLKHSWRPETELCLGKRHDSVEGLSRSPTRAYLAARTRVCRNWKRHWKPRQVWMTSDLAISGLHAGHAFYSLSKVPRCRLSLLSQPRLIRQTLHGSVFWCIVRRWASNFQPGFKMLLQLRGGGGLQ